MMRGAGLWGAGTVASVASHAVAAALLIWAIKPGPVEDQPKPQTKLNMTTYQVARSAAKEATPEMTAALQNTAESSRLAAHGPALQRSQAVKARSEKIPQAPPVSQTAPRIAARSTPLTNTVAQSATPAQALNLPAPTLASAVTVQNIAQAVSVSATEAQPIAAASVQTQTITLLQPASDTAKLVVSAALTLPPAPLAAPPAPAANLSTTQAIANTPQAMASADVPLSADAAVPLALPALEGQATLAFAAPGDGPVDPVSLTAFQSFMRPGDLRGSSDDVKDDLASVISGVPCSRVQVRFEPLDNALVVSGHVPEDALRGSVLQAMQEKMGADIPVLDNLLILPSPQCGALAGIAGVGLPQSTDQITNPLLVGDDTHAREFRYVAEQPMVLTLQGADYDAYVYVDYFDAAGNVIHLLPNAHTPMKRAPKQSAIKVGSDRALQPGETGLFMKVGPPYGQEIAVAFAASAPLYDGVRPLSEPAAPYLDWLKDKVAEAKSTHPDFKGEWVYFFVSTSAE